MLFNRKVLLLSALALICTTSMAEPSQPFLHSTTNSPIRLGFKGLFAKDFATITPHQDTTQGEQSEAHGVKSFLGLGVAFEIPLLKFLAAGAQFDTIMSTGADVLHFNIDAVVKLPFAIGNHPLGDDFYLSLLGGATLGHFLDSAINPVDIPLGFNAGLLLGKGFAINERYNIFAEVGYRFSQLKAKFEHGTPYSYLAHSVTTGLGVSIDW